MDFRGVDEVSCRQGTEEVISEFIAVEMLLVRKALAGLERNVPFSALSLRSQ